MTTPHTTQPLTREEIAWLMRALWSALQAPRWTFGNRKDLEKLGEAIISGKKLKELDSELLDRIFPYLLIITGQLGSALKNKGGEDSTPLSREETAWLMRTIWEALQTPDWSSQNRKDIEKLGEALYSGKELKDLGDKILDRIFPHLVTVTTHLGNTLAAKAAEEDDLVVSSATPVAPQAAPATPVAPVMAPAAPVAPVMAPAAPVAPVMAPADPATPIMAPVAPTATLEAPPEAKEEPNTVAETAPEPTATPPEAHVEPSPPTPEIP